MNAYKNKTTNLKHFNSSDLLGTQMMDWNNEHKENIAIKWAKVTEVSH